MFFILCCILLETPNDEIVKASFVNSYGTLIEDIAYVKSLAAKFYYPIFLFRRIVYALIVTVLTNYPTIQLLSSIIIVIFPVLFYI